MFNIAHSEYYRIKDEIYPFISQVAKHYNKPISHIRHYALFSLFVHFFSSSVTELKHNLSLSILAFFLLDL